MRDLRELIRQVNEAKRMLNSFKQKLMAKGKLHVSYSKILA